MDLFGLKDLLLDFNDKTLADEDSYYNNLNKELIYAVINDYRDSNTSIDLYIKQLSNNQDNILKKYSQQYKKRISTIFDKRIDKQTDDVLRNYEIEEKNKSLQMLDNIKSEQWNKATEAADKYLKAFNILVNIVNQYK